jgi:tetratricopeptide (TPR) repeat protein
MTRRVLVALLAAAACCAHLGCAARAHIGAPGPEMDEARRAVRASELVCEGSLAALREALQLLSAAPRAEAELRLRVRVALLANVRQRELGIADDRLLDEAKRLASSCARCEDLVEAADIVSFLGLWQHGVAGEDTERRPERPWQHAPQLVGWAAALAARPSDELSAYLLLALDNAYRGFVRPSIDSSAILARHDCPLFAFRAALSDPARLSEVEALAARAQRFRELHYLLGARALDHARDFAAAERYLSRALEAFPESPSVCMATADLALALRDSQTALDGYDRVLALAPTHRQALLRRAICLSFLDKPDAALVSLSRLAELRGSFLPGEHAYWVASNLAALQRYEGALEPVKVAMDLLDGDSRPLALAGHIEHALGRAQEAERDLLAAVEVDAAACDALFELGDVRAEGRRWFSAGEGYAAALTCQESARETLAEELRTLQTTQLSPARRARIAAMREADIEARAFTAAKSAYNAAVCFLRAGRSRRAGELAAVAEKHPAYADKARELVAARERRARQLQLIR